jgi:hypothetical protein
MIYKFYRPETSNSLEFELFNETNQSMGLPDVVNVSITDLEIDEMLLVDLTKQDVFRLIGALHLLHKEMK